MNDVVLGVLFASLATIGVARLAGAHRVRRALRSAPASVKSPALVAVVGGYAGGLGLIVASLYGVATALVSAPRAVEVVLLVLTTVAFAVLVPSAVLDLRNRRDPAVGRFLRRAARGETPQDAGN